MIDDIRTLHSIILKNLPVVEGVTWKTQFSEIPFMEAKEYVGEQLPEPPRYRVLIAAEFFISRSPLHHESIHRIAKKVHEITSAGQIDLNIERFHD